jgi:tol-pal system protein YbgF
MRLVRTTLGFSLTVCSLTVVSALSLGCSRQETGADRQIAQLQDELARVQADQDRTYERVGDQEQARAAQPAGRRNPAGVEPKSIQLNAPSDEPPEPPPGEDTEDTSPRPAIKVTGVPGQRTLRGKSAGRNDRVEATVDSDEPKTDRSVRASALDPEAKRAYERALSAVQGRRYAEGLEGLSAFLVKWPDHPYAENAFFWRGEAFFAQGDFTRAAEQYENVIARATTGAKVPDAFLKLAQCQDKLGQADKAKATYERLAREYPRSDAAKRIPHSGSSVGPRDR